MSQTTYISEIQVKKIKILENVLKMIAGKKIISEFNTVSLLSYRKVYWVGA